MAALPAHRVAGLYLARRVRFGMKLGLETMRALVAEMGHPERAYPSLLVAGTNGKGSVAAYCDAALRASGLRTGRYTSPHLVRVNERITVDGSRDHRPRLRDRGARRPRRGRAARPPRGPRGAPDLLRGDDRRRLRALPPQAGGRGRPRGGPRRQARRDQRRGARRLRHRQHRLRPRGVPGPDPRRDRGREGGCPARGAADRDRPAARRSAPGRPRALARASARASSRRAAAPASPPRERARIAPRHLFDLRTPTARYERLRPLPGAHQRDNLLVAIRLLEEAKRAGVPVDLRKLAAAVARTRWPGRLECDARLIPRSSSTAPTTPPARAPSPRTFAGGPADRPRLRGDVRQGRARPRARALPAGRRGRPHAAAHRARRDAGRARPPGRPPRRPRPPPAERRPRSRPGPTPRARARADDDGRGGGEPLPRRRRQGGSWSGRPEATARPQRAGTPSSTPRK